MSVDLALGGTAPFLAGHALFKWAIFGVLPWSHVAAILVLAMLTSVGFELPTLALSGAPGLIVVFLGVWETLAYQGSVRWARRPNT